MKSILDMTVRDALRSLACSAFIAFAAYLPLIWWLVREW